MKIASKINPKNLFRSKNKNKNRSVSRSDPSSFSSYATTSSGSPESSHRHHKSKSSGGATTPTSVLGINSHSNEISSDDWLENPTNDVVQFELVQATSSGSPESTNRHRHNSKSSGGVTTPTTVLRTNSHSQSHEISSDDWFHNSTNDVVQFELVQAFRFIDIDGDGKITRSELEAVLSRIGGSEPLIQEELSLMLNEIDRDADGIITLEEFGAISSAFSPAACDTELREVFEFFDADHDGRITAEELFAVFDSIGEGRRCTLEECRCMISSVDVNGDGFVCFEDFSRMMMQQR